MATQNQISKSGTKSSHIVEGVSVDQLEKITTGPVMEQDDGTVKVSLNNKRERAALDELIAQANKPESRPEQRKTGHWSRRYIKRLHDAERDGDSHGKAWRCKEIDIETKGAMPEWEDELICYVYE